jgi:hypothetical protein
VWTKYGPPEVLQLQEVDKPVERMDPMKKENFLTVRWNNWLTLGLGLPALIYVVVAFSTSAWTGRGGLIGLSIIGVLY